MEPPAYGMHALWSALRNELARHVEQDVALAELMVPTPQVFVAMSRIKYDGRLTPKISRHQSERPGGTRRAAAVDGKTAVMAMCLYMRIREYFRKIRFMNSSTGAVSGDPKSSRRMYRHGLGCPSTGSNTRRESLCGRVSKSRKITVSKRNRWEIRRHSRETSEVLSLVVILS